MTLSLRATKKRALGALAAAMLLFPATALGKGPTEASIEGPGLSSTVTMTGDGELGGNELGNLTQLSGFPAAVFGHRDPDPMLRDQPKGELGPRYTITYTVPGPDRDTFLLRQDVYPYATPRPVTYVEPGQRIFQGMTTYGGWFRASPKLKRTLVSAGLPATQPAVGSPGESSSPILTLSTLTAAVMLIAASAFFVLRRRRHAAVG